MSGFKKICWDFDYIKFAAASACEKRSIRVVHKKAGSEKVFKNRTEFYGRDKDKSGGWLGELNAKRTSPFLLEEFEIFDVQEPEPLSNCLHTVKMMIKDVCSRLGTQRYYGYIGKGDSFRVELSTILKYKGNREGMLRPVLLPEVEDYLLKRHNASIVEHLEADDQVVIDNHKNSNLIIVGVDKDYKGCTGITLFNPNQFEAPEKIQSLGKLWLNEKGEVDGRGRLFLYYQIASGDDSDNYKANSGSKVAWGSKSAYKALVGCQTDEEAWAALKRIYQKLYPVPTKIVGWRGNEIEIDWLYVLEENFQMARMLRWEHDNVKAEDVLRGFNLL